MVAHNIQTCPNQWVCLECYEEFGSESARMRHGEDTEHQVEH